MTEISQSETSRSHIVHLLEQQEYDEALPILSDLMEKNPSDREFSTYHLLVVRILVLRWYLSRAATEPAVDPRTIAKTIIRRLASVVHIPETTKLIHSLSQIHQAAQTALSKWRIKRVIIAGTGSALLALYMVESSNVEIPVPSNMLTSTYASHSTVSALSTNPNNSRTADGDGRRTQLPREADERNLFRITSEPRELLPTEHLQELTEQKLTRTGTDVEKATPQVNASKLLGKPQQPGAVSNIESSRELANNENNADETPREIVGYYQSRRAIPIRKSTSFAAPIVQEVDSGISFNVLEFVGPWAKVELAPAGITGFVRREFLITVKKKESTVTHSSPSGEEISDATVFPLGPSS